MMMIWLIVIFIFFGIIESVHRLRWWLFQYHTIAYKFIWYLIAHIAEAPDLICMYYVKLCEAYDMEGKDPNIMK